jgi:hypothetical protein
VYSPINRIAIELLPHEKKGYDLLSIRKKKCRGTNFTRDIHEYDQLMVIIIEMDAYVQINEPKIKRIILKVGTIYLQ